MTSTNASRLSPAPSLIPGREARARQRQRHGRLPARLARLAAVGVAVEFAGITIVSLVPGADRPHALPSGQLEHALAYGIAGATIAIAFRTARTRLLAAIPFALGAGAFELLQTFVPDRGPRLIDALASSSGLGAGLAAGAAGVALLARRRAISSRP
ncbi:VanZ family protein [Methylosinus sp. Sm6]|uniref:VanZ family protein n=1 Tax=Methylosinus sp. Sm6 TaxID=2866948 RepID=UPI001C9902C9|nr:VanZ family protein [Methylosinus sp. Sm6]MBY6244002.1 VanZ family protein [Methylosinus sp. Sm6]